MFGYKSILQLSGALSGLADLKSIMGNGVNSEYELADFSYEIVQETDVCGKPQGEVCSGLMHISFWNLPTTEIVEWMINPRTYKSGSVVIYDMEDMPLQKVTFSSTACVSLEVEYQEDGKNYCRTNLTLSAKVLNVGDVRMENEWKNV
ncbi:MAG: type VI secretion system needle protein Hcp [Paludibacteraceae bacterium]|nr:type VI secretion system needle protein Hcp [Paludibacteraceae bacterium]MBR4839536.1 type VI secretion system needle protein Hcp [Paludibacteraceae bacterium]